MSTTQIKKKSFWKRPEGITGTLFIGAMLFGLYKMLPYLITFAENTIYLAFLVGGASLITYVILDNRSLLWYGYKTLMYRVTNFFVRIDPIAIAKVYIGQLKRKKNDMDEQIDKLGGAVKKLEADIKENDKGIEEKMTLAKKAEEIATQKEDAGMRMKAIGLTKEVIYLKNANAEISPLLTSMNSMKNYLKKASDVSQYIISDKETEISIMEKKYKSINIGLTALRSAKAIMGQDEKEALFEQSMEFLKEDMANKLSEMDRIIEMANPYVQQMELENAVNTHEAQVLLEKFSTSEFDKVLQSLQNKSVSAAPVMLDAKIASGKTDAKKNEYSDILNS
jgi:hypothetical protein